MKLSRKIKFVLCGLATLSLGLLIVVHEIFHAMILTGAMSHMESLAFTTKDQHFKTKSKIPTNYIDAFPPNDRLGMVRDNGEAIFLTIGYPRVCYIYNISVGHKYIFAMNRPLRRPFSIFYDWFVVSEEGKFEMIETKPETTNDIWPTLGIEHHKKNR